VSTAVQVTAPETFWFCPSTRTVVAPEATADPDVEGEVLELPLEHPVMAQAATAALTTPIITTRVTMSSP
jgi:hypothetical protein